MSCVSDLKHLLHQRVMCYFQAMLDSKLQPWVLHFRCFFFFANYTISGVSFLKVRSGIAFLKVRSGIAYLGIKMARCFFFFLNWSAQNTGHLPTAW
jgi:hypothetical protein